MSSTAPGGLYEGCVERMDRDPAREMPHGRIDRPLGGA